MERAQERAWLIARTGPTTPHDTGPRRPRKCCAVYEIVERHDLLVMNVFDAIRKPVTLLVRQRESGSWTVCTRL